MYEVAKDRGLWEEILNDYRWLQVKTEIIFFEWWKYFKIDYGDFSNSTKINEHYTLNEFFLKKFLRKYLFMGFNKP